MASFWSGNSAIRHGLAQVRAAAGRLRSYGGFWLKAFRNPPSISPCAPMPGFTRIVESPGRALSQPDLDRLVADFRTVAGKTLPAGSLTYGIFSGERERLARAIVTLISDEATGRPIAFNALSVMSVELDGEPEHVTHLGLVMIDPDAQGQGLSWVLYGLTTLVLFAATACARNGFQRHPGAGGVRHGLRHLLGRVPVPARRRAQKFCASATGARDHA